MKKFLPLLVLALSLGVPTGCGSSGSADAPALPAGENVCRAPLVGMQIGPDPTCASGPEHWFPLGPDEESCHGWAGTANDGDRHENSANAIRCNADGTFEYTQFAGNLECRGTGVRKVYEPGVCEQDIPPVLYALPVDLACCTDPDGPDCIVGVPEAGPVGAVITLDGVECEPADP